MILAEISQFDRSSTQVLTLKKCNEFTLAWLLYKNQNKPMSLKPTSPEELINIILNFDVLVCDLCTNFSEVKKIIFITCILASKF